MRGLEAYQRRWLDEMAPSRNSAASDDGPTNSGRNPAATPASICTHARMHARMQTSRRAGGQAGRASIDGLTPCHAMPCHAHALPCRAASPAKAQARASPGAATCRDGVRTAPTVVTSVAPCRQRVFLGRRRSGWLSLCQGPETPRCRAAMRCFVVRPSE